jgi:hypothetical protein
MPSLYKFKPWIKVLGTFLLESLFYHYCKCHSNIYLMGIIIFVLFDFGASYYLS